MLLSFLLAMQTVPSARPIDVDIDADAQCLVALGREPTAGNIDTARTIAVGVGYYLGRLTGRYAGPTALRQALAPAIADYDAAPVADHGQARDCLKQVKAALDQVDAVRPGLR